MKTSISASPLLLLVLLIPTSTSLSSCASSGAAGSSNVTAICVGTIGGGAALGGVAGRMIGDSMGSKTAGTIIGAAAGGGVGIAICRRAWLQAQALQQRIEEVEAAPPPLIASSEQEVLTAMNQEAVEVPEEPLPPLPQPKDSYNLEVVENRSIRFDLNSSLLFRTGSSTLQAEALSRLDAVAESLVEYPDSRITVIGHTDNTGSEELNQRLSLARANAVVKYLRHKGVTPARLESVGRGEMEPRFPNDSAYRRALNRRVEILIIPV